MKHVTNISVGKGLLLMLAVTSASFVFSWSAQAAGPWYVTTTGNDANDCLSPATACLTIQAAINKASAGDTVNVAAGTYAENVVLNKDVTLNGAQAGIDARARAASESVIAPPSGIGVELQAGSAGATLDGFTISGGTRGIESSSGPLDGLGILNNRIVLFTGAGIFLNDSGTDITVDKNLIDASSQSAGGGTVHLDTDAFDGFWFTDNSVVNGAAGTGLFSDGTRNVGVSGARSPKMTGNLFQGDGTGANLGRKSWEFADISGNTFKSSVYDGLQGGPADSTLSGNLFDGNGRSGLALTGFGGGTDATRGAQRNTVTLNTFTGNGVEGVFLSSSQFAGTISTNVINRNSIAGNTSGITYTGAESINGQCNWWGAASGPGPVGPGSGDTVSANVDYSTWLTSSDTSGPCNGPLPEVTVTIVKFINGRHAAAGSAATSSFPMTSSWNAENIGAGSGSFSLGPVGFNNPNPYEATTALMTPGADYSVSEDTTGQVVGADCTAMRPYTLTGYTVGDTLGDAQAATPTTTPPSLTGLLGNKFVIVWNNMCLPAPTLVSPADNSTTTTAGLTEVDWTDVTDPAGGITYVYQVSNSPSTNPDGSFSSPVYTSGPLATSSIPTPGTPAGEYYWHVRAADADGNVSPWSVVWKFAVENPVPPTFLKVHVLKYLDGQKATAPAANSIPFPMTESLTAPNINGGAATSTDYWLGMYRGGAPDRYGADSVSMQAPASYSTSEVTSVNSIFLPIGAQCSAHRFQLVGYTTSAVGFADAASQTPTSTPPSFSGLQSDRYVIVWNRSCTQTATLNVMKRSQGGSGTFTFSGNNGLGSFTITTFGTLGLRTFSNIPPGTYTITETVPSGWTQRANTCVNVVLSAGRSATCVIYNTKNRGNPPPVLENSVTRTNEVAPAAVVGNTGADSQLPKTFSLPAPLEGAVGVGGSTPHPDRSARVVR